MSRPSQAIRKNASRRTIQRIVAGGVLALLLSACAGQPPVLPDTLPRQVLLDDVPFIDQADHACGPASLAMVLQYHHHPASRDVLTPLLVLPEREGTLQVELTAAARREGFLALAGASTLPDLLEDVAAGFPVIVLQNLGLPALPKWHYAVVSGFEREGSDDGVVLLRSGDHPLIEVPFQTFMNTWERSAYWALRVTPAQHLPPSATPEAVLTAAEDLAASRYPARALATYTIATRRWPHAENLWNAMGNLAYTQSRWQVSRSAFAHSLALKPTQARVWNNLAYSLQRSGCMAQADAALQCAESLAPADPLINDTRAELAILPAGAQHSCKTVIRDCKIEPASLEKPVYRLQ